MLRMCAALLLTVLLASCAQCLATPGAAQSAVADADDRRILVMIADPDISRFDLRGARSGPYRRTSGYPGRSARVARALREIAAEYRLQPIDGWAMQSLRIYCEVFEVGPERTVDGLIAALAMDARVESVQRMQQFELEASAGIGRWNDPYRPLQHALEDLRITEAHRWATGRGVLIAVVDTGVDVSHRELSGQIAEARDFTSASAAATADRHGTAVAGIIASLAGNRQGIVGVAPGAKLLALKACEQRRADGDGVCTSFSLARAIDHAIVVGSNVLNLSLGGPPDRLLERLLVSAIEQGIVVISAFADSGGRVSFPASMDGVIGVSDENSSSDARWLKAPGLEVLTLVPPDDYDFLSGSSLAAAHVSGIVALLLERAPGLRAVEIQRLLTRTSRRVERDDSGTAVMVSACAALAEITGAAVCDGAVGQARTAVAGRAELRLEAD